MNRLDVEEWADNGACDQLSQMEAGNMSIALVSAFMRAAYGQGYVDAHSVPEPITIDQAVRNREMLLLELPV